MATPTTAALRDRVTKIIADAKALNAELCNAWSSDMSTLAIHREAVAHMTHALLALNSVKYAIGDLQIATTPLTPADMAEAADAIGRG